ncbi:uroporphyrinogen-III synthase [Photobacterium leiognathi]|uniref:uroporphyrinogen-III synthase n=1 Tax=Photobacterium leiognathi TaxID=553611 RepID=UPI0027376D14|nr:uroporphyrinogen-III synthase [Photobacterium leiognathi]
MTVLITRPAPDCYQLAEQLNATAISALAQPLLTLKASDGLSSLLRQLNELTAGDYIIAVSHHAVTFAHDYLISQGAAWPKNVHYIAVGHKTAATLTKLSGQQVSSPAHRCDSEGLLALPELADMAGRNVLILRGNGGRELIHQALTARQAVVNYCETYQRCWLDLDGEKLIQQWQHQHVDTLVITSAEQLVFLTQKIPTQHLTWFFHCHLLVPSQRVAEQAATLGFVNISTVGSASNHALFTFLSNFS